MPNIGRKAMHEEHRRVEANRPAPQRDEHAGEDDDRRDRDDHRRGLEEGGDADAHAGQIHVVRPDDEREEADRQDGIDQGLVAPERLARVVGDDLGDDAHRRQDQHIDLRVRQEPEQVLPQQRAAAAADVGEVPADRQAGRQEEAGVRHLVHQLHDGRGLQRRKGQQQQEGRDELRPDEERQAHPGHARRAQLDDRGDEVDRAQQRRGDQEHHADDPEGLPVGRNRRRQRGIGGPARLRRAAGDEEAGEHDQPADHVGLVARHVDAREGHVRRADLQRHDVIAERAQTPAARWPGRP